MTYKPHPTNAAILDRALYWATSVPYTVTARWVFYRLLQEGAYSTKAGYKHLLGILSAARKGFYGGWRPWTLADDSRAAVVRGDGFTSPASWLKGVRDGLACNLDKWADQPVYVECWFEAAAMSAQFEHYTPPYIPLLAFHGDVSIPEKWKAAKRLAQRYLKAPKPVHIYYFGDNDPKGLVIPHSAWDDIRRWTLNQLQPTYKDAVGNAARDFHFHRVGLNPGQEIDLDIPENPERPGTYQWEALGDDQAADLIRRASDHLEDDAFRMVEDQQEVALAAFRKHLDKLNLSDLS